MWFLMLLALLAACDNPYEKCPGKGDTGVVEESKAYEHFEGRGGVYRGWTVKLKRDSDGTACVFNVSGESGWIYKVGDKVRGPAR